MKEMNKPIGVSDPGGSVTTVLGGRKKMSHRFAIFEGNITCAMPGNVNNCGPMVWPLATKVLGF
jgi:hypothetical protein